ncbi:MAG TPA: DUF3488 and transglutaminase-like domain-containing protein [Pyrinomonadaceae bacterium]|nr:DUF3488 and transglutaminase-like domain-containing protein [Pyrinomonadaceae bacterium]
MHFETFFRLVSYAVFLCGFLALWVSGTFGVLVTGLFLAVMLAAWFLEGSRWQISEKVGTALIVLALPVFYLGWQQQIFTPTGGETWIAGVLARMILALSAIKLVQKKGDRDWVFLYLMAFFEVLLAAGLSISALYLGSFLLYLLVMVCAIIAFEIRKTARSVEDKMAGTAPEKTTPDAKSGPALRVARLPATAIALILAIIALALPLFFMLPRVGGAGFGGSHDGLKTRSGFSDRVRLGEIGRIQRDDAVVMRVKIDGDHSDAGLYFRGVALDTFDNLTWSNSRPVKETKVKFGSDPILLDFAASRENLTIQTIYLEPLDTPVLFGLPRMVGVQGNFPMVYRDAFGSISYSRNLERTSYRVISDRSLPAIDQLRSDDKPYTGAVQNFRSLPAKYDERIARLAAEVTAGAENRYDGAKAIENYLRESFGYTLELKAGGPEPLADFLFNIREGHCEYFATAMAIMLRTQGVATRVVNGFHGGDYNETADVTVVRQSNAHAWVEVYFPGENVWVTFDPTPSAVEQPSTGIGATAAKYLEALETFWIQYFVAFDNQEQRSLMRSVRDGFLDYQVGAATYLGRVRDSVAEWLAEVRGDKGFEASRIAITYGLVYLSAVTLGILLMVWLGRKVLRLGIWSRLRERFLSPGHDATIEFYDRMQQVLRRRGHERNKHETPLEFAFEVGAPEALEITRIYNGVRFGKKRLSRDEADEIETMLQKLEMTNLGVTAR